MPALYEIAAEHRALIEAVEAAQDEAEASNALALLTANETDLTAKITSVAMFIRNQDATADMIEEAAKAQLARAKAMRNRADNVREYLLHQMRSGGVSKVECPHFRMSIRKCPPSVRIIDAAAIPAEYMRQPEPPPPAPDKRAILDAFKATGEIVAGCEIEQGERLEIK